MSSFEPPSPSQEPLNPYAAPLSEVGAAYVEAEVGDVEAETTRRLYLGHEAAVRSLGSLHYLGAFFGMTAVLGMIVNLVFNVRVEMWPLAGSLIAFFCLMTALNGTLGYGLYHLQTWARWTEVVLMVFGTLGSLVTIALSAGEPRVGLIYGFVLLFDCYVLYLLLSTRGTVVFSPGYQAVIEKTPHLKYKTSLIVKVAVGIFGIFLGLIALALLLVVIGVLGPRP